MKHEYRKEVYALLRRLSGQRATLAIPRFLIEIAGGYEEAAMLNQILFWARPKGEDPGWFYKSRAEWAEELALTEKQVRRARDNLEARKLIQTKIRRLGNSPVTWYAPDPEGILELVDNHRPKRADDWPSGAGALALEGQSSITQDYAQDSAFSQELSEEPVDISEAIEEADMPEQLRDLLRATFSDSKEHL